MRGGADGAAGDGEAAQEDAAEVVEGAGGGAEAAAVRAEGVADVGMELADGLNELGIGVGDGDGEFVLDLHDEFDGVESHGHSFYKVNANIIARAGREQGRCAMRRVVGRSGDEDVKHGVTYGRRRRR